MRSAFLAGGASLVAVLAMIAVMLATAGPVVADIVYSGDIDVPVPIGGSGSGIALYVDVDTFTFSETTFEGWDLRLSGNSTTFLTTNTVSLSNDHFISFGGFPPYIARIDDGFTVGSSGPYQSLGGGTMSLTSGPADYRFLADSENLCGFRHVTPDGQTQYGWLKMGVGSDFLTRSLRGVAIEDSGAAIAAGAVPEPGSAALMAMAALLGLRRRRA